MLAITSEYEGCEISFNVGVEEDTVAVGSGSGSDADVDAFDMTCEVYPFPLVERVVDESWTADHADLFPS